MKFHKFFVKTASPLAITAMTGLHTVEQLRDQHALSVISLITASGYFRQVASRWRTKQDLPWRTVVKHIVVLSALIMMSTLTHAGVMPEDLMLPSAEATKEVIDQAIISEPTFQEKLDGFLQFVMMSLLVLI
jgi:hypothetical protein